MAPSSDVAAPAADVSMQVDEAEPKAKKSKTVEDKEVPKEAISAIAKPLAGKKLGKHVLKLVKKGKLRRSLGIEDDSNWQLTFSRIAFFLVLSFQVETSQERSQGSCQVCPEGREGVSQGSVRRSV